MAREHYRYAFSELPSYGYGADKYLQELAIDNRSYPRILSTEFLKIYMPTPHSRHQLYVSVNASDVASLSEQAYEGIFPPVTGVFSENSPYYVKPDNYPEYNPDKARELAQEYETKYGKPLEFSTNITGQPEVQLVAQVLQAQLKEVGITVNLETQEQLTSLRALGCNLGQGYLLGRPHPL